MTLGHFIEHLDALYATLPRIDCQRRCGFHWCGAILMSSLEVVRWHPHLPPGAKPGGVCPMLKGDGSCGCYQERPAICRTAGVVERLRCPHGCVPERWMTETEHVAFLRRVDDLADLAAMTIAEARPTKEQIDWLARTETALRAFQVQIGEEWAWWRNR